ncbi:hypothetical protein LXL04_016326 [Taraxacum kok-saghyz]
MAYSLVKTAFFAMLLFSICVFGDEIEIYADKNIAGEIRNQIHSTVDVADEGHNCKKFIDCDIRCPPYMFPACLRGNRRTSILRSNHNRDRSYIHLDNSVNELSHLRYVNGKLGQLRATMQTIKIASNSIQQLEVSVFNLFCTQVLVFLNQRYFVRLEEGVYAHPGVTLEMKMEYLIVGRLNVVSDGNTKSGQKRSRGSSNS